MLIVEFLSLGGGWGLHSHFRVKPNRCVVLCWGWGFDKRVFKGYEAILRDL